MMIDQRNAGASVTPTSNVFGPDRWTPQLAQSSKFSYRQMESANTSASNYESSSAPTGFTNSLKITSSSAYTPVTGDYMLIRQHIEGYNVADLDWGLATAKTVTVSFWVKSSLTGSHSFSVYNFDGSRSYPVLYTINTANTWEYKTIVIPGDTSGTWKKDSNIGISIAFSIGSGATYSGPSGAWASAWYPAATGAVPLIGTSSATLYITGVQFEKGTAASTFEFRSYQKELMLCQRYYQLYTATSVEWIYNEDATTNHKWWQCYLTGATMRTTPSATFIGSWTGGTSGGLTGTIASMTATDISVNRFIVRVGMSADGGTSHLMYHTDGWQTKQIGFTSEY
jgi:hypothetical protein